jgi:formamidopyrimidine-DNA glycosylase
VPELPDVQVMKEYMEATSLHQQIEDVEVLRVAIKRRAQPDKFPDDYLTPHRGTEHECPRCGGPIKRTEVSGWSSYFCPQC